MNSKQSLEFRNNPRKIDKSIFLGNYNQARRAKALLAWKRIITPEIRAKALISGKIYILGEFFEFSEKRSIFRERNSFFLEIKLYFPKNSSNSSKLVISREYATKRTLCWKIYPNLRIFELKLE